MSVTLPTLTSLTLTVDWGTRSSTSRNSTETLIGSLPVSVPPGSGSAVTSKSQALSVSGADQDEDREEPGAHHRTATRPLRERSKLCS